MRHVLTRGRSTLQRFLADKRGVWMMEFALITPVFLGSSMLALEYSHLVLSRQKMERVAANSADLFARNVIPPNEDQVNDIFRAVNQVARPLDLRTNGRVIVTGVIGTSDSDTGDIENKVAWQRCYGLRPATSQVGQEHTATTNYADGPEVPLPGGIELPIAQMVIVAETTYGYQPLIGEGRFLGVLRGNELRERSVHRVRGQAFTSITPFVGVTASTC